MILTTPPKIPPQTLSPIRVSRPVPSGNGQMPTPTHEQIARRAYDIYIAHNRTDGRSELDWRQAEEELTHQAHALLLNARTPAKA